MFVIKQHASSGRRAKRWPKLIPKICLKIEKILEKGVKIHQKSEEIVPRSAQKATLAASRFQNAKKGATSFHNFEIFGAIWVILGVIWCPAGRQGVPKSRVLAPGCAKISKNDIQNEASEKVWFFVWICIGKCEILKVLNPPKCFIYKHLGGFSRLW